MKHSILLASLCLFGAVVAGPALAAGATSTFDTDVDGWTVTDWSAGDSTSTNWVSPGLIQTGDVYNWNVFSAPAKFLGDHSAVYGGTLSFDLQDMEKDGAADQDFTVQLVGGGLALSWFGGSPSTASLTHFSATLSEAATGWRVGPCTQISECSLVPNAPQFQAVMASLERLHINADWHTGGDDVRLDNVVMAAVPEPGSWVLMLAGLAAVGGVLRRRS